MDAQWPGGHTPSDLSPAVGPSSQKLREADARPPHAFLGGLGSVSALLVLSERPDFPYLSKGAAGLLACGEGTPGSRAPPPRSRPSKCGSGAASHGCVHTGHAPASPGSLVPWRRRVTRLLPRGDI